MTDTVELIVQADDFGMCPAVTDGILRCFDVGALTQSSVIVPAPDAGRAMRKAVDVGLPLGVHLALVCEWPGLRWGPLTSAESLRVPDGAFPDDLDVLRKQALPGEVEQELFAQLRAADAEGVRVRHIESHVRVYDADILAKVSVTRGLPCRDTEKPPGIDMGLTSLWHLSTQPTESKLANLVEHVENLPAGRHMIVAHPAEDRAELTGLCPPDSRRWKWARDIRLGDQRALLDPRFRRACETRGVQLMALPEPPPNDDTVRLIQRD